MQVPEPVTLEPPDCVMCGRDRPRIAYCDSIHVSGFQPARGRRDYHNTTAFGDSPQPHMHCTCWQCGYEWIIPALKSAL